MSGLLPLRIPGTEYTVEPGDNKYVTGIGKTWLQSSNQDNTDSGLPPVLPSAPVRRLWKALGDYSGDGRPEPFYDRTLHKDVKKKYIASMLKQLEEEIHYCSLFVRGILVVKNDGDLISGLDSTPRPALITPEIYTTRTVVPKDEVHGMTLGEFKAAGGRIVAHNIISTGTLLGPQLKNREYTSVHEEVGELGVCKGDDIFPDLHKKESALGWNLCRRGEGTSVLYADSRLDGWDQFRGVLRGRNINDYIQS